MLRSVNQAGLKAHGFDEKGSVIIINQFGVGEYFGFYAEQTTNHIIVHLHFAHKLLRILKGSQRVRISAAEEFDTLGVGKFLQQIDKFRHIELELLNSCSGYRESTFESAIARVDHFKQSISHRDI